MSIKNYDGKTLKERILKIEKLFYWAKTEQEKDKKISKNRLKTSQISDHFIVLFL